MQFHEKLYTLRKQSNLTQADLAEKLNVSRQAVSRWEMGTAKPEVDTLVAISDLFGVSLDELLKNKESAPEGVPETPDVLPNFRDFLPKLWWLPGAGAALCKLLSYGMLLLMGLMPSYYGDYYEKEYLFAEVTLIPLLNSLASLCFWMLLLALAWTLLKWWKAK